MSLEKYHKMGEIMDRFLRPNTFPVAYKLIKDESEIPEKALRPLRNYKTRLLICQCLHLTKTTGRTHALPAPLPECSRVPLLDRVAARLHAGCERTIIRTFLGRDRLLFLPLPTLPAAHAADHGSCGRSLARIAGNGTDCGTESSALGGATDSRTPPLVFSLIGR